MRKPANLDGGAGVALLHLDTGERVLERVEGLLEGELGTISVRTVTTATAALEELEGGGIDCVLSGTDTSEMGSLDFLEEARSVRPNVPFIFYDTSESEGYVTEAISVGANDVIHPETQTDYTEFLSTRITNLVEQYRTQQQLEESHRQFSTLVSNLPGMVYRCELSPEWPMLFVSEGCRRLTGYGAEALVDGRVQWGEDILATADRERVWRMTREAVEGGESFRCDYQIVTADGERKWVWEQGRAVESGDDPVILEGFITDITERKRQTERLNVLNRVLRHNLRNRMSVILSHAGHLETRLDEDSLRDHTATVRDTAREVAALSDSVADIEDILQITADARRPVDLTRTVERVATDLRTEYPAAGIAVDIEQEWWVDATDKLELAVRHALDNALAHNDGETPSALARVTAERSGVVTLEIADDGPGIDPVELAVLDDHEEITGLSHGSGLGLWLLKWFTDQVDGDLTFDEREPTGTVVSIHLQRATPPSEGSS